MGIALITLLCYSFQPCCSAGKRRYNIKLWKTFTDCFNCLPVAAIVDEKIFCCHGGLSPDLHSMEQIRRIQRPTDVPDQGLLCDLLWSDPDKDVMGWGENDRGVSYTFGADVVAKFLHKHDLDLICRAHQVCRARPAGIAQRSRFCIHTFFVIMLRSVVHACAIRLSLFCIFNCALPLLITIIVSLLFCRRRVRLD